MIPHDFIPNLKDTALHLLFVSIAALEPNYHLYLVGSSLKAIAITALLYIHPLRFTELTSIYQLLDLSYVQKVLRLELGLFINNPYAIHESPTYMHKSQLLTPLQPESLPLAEALIPSSAGVLRMHSALVADINMHSRDYNIISRITRGYEARISCILMIDSPSDRELLRCLECYHNQTHTNKELIIVGNLKLKDFITQYIEAISYEHLILWVDNPKSLQESWSDLWNIAIRACTGNYVLRWNLGDWYHPTMLSILADRTDGGNYDYIGLTQIIQLKPNKQFVISGYKFQGWDCMLLIHRDKVTDLDQWNACESIYMLDPGYEVLYVHNKHTPTSGEQSVSPSLQQYYEAVFTLSESIKSSMGEFTSKMYTRMVSYLQSDSQS